MTATATADPLIEELAAGLLAPVRQGLLRAGPGADLAPVVARAAVGAGTVLGTGDLAAVTARVADRLWGLGPLQPLVLRPGVTDILVNGPGEVWVDQGSGLERVDCPLGDEAAVRALAVRLAAGAGRRLDESCPWVDARLTGGVRLHALLPPISPSGTVISLRLLREEAFGLADLVRFGSVPAAWAEVLTGLVVARASFLVGGGTGAGKTTLLAALLSAAPAPERIVLVEDVGELRPSHPHVVRLEARRANVEGEGEISLADLVRQALRMRPDRLVVGECRGPEVRDLLGALNTGHQGGCGTVHANAARDVPARLEALGALAGMSPEAVAVQAAAALDVVIHVERCAGLRRVVEVATVHRARRGFTLQPALVADPDDPADPGERGPGYETLVALCSRR
jgi:pilus assembly protein CpaF